MAIKISIEMNNKFRKDLTIVSEQSADDLVNLIFSQGSVTLLGYSNSSFCLCKEYIDCDVDYSFRVQSGILLAMNRYSTIEFNIELDKVTIEGKDKDGSMKRRAQIKINTDTTANYQADLYNSIIKQLRSGYACNSLEHLRQFYKISKVNPKGERGVIISNNQFYTCGEGYKFYATTDMPFDCFILSEDLISLVEFVGVDDNILYLQGSYIIAKNTNDCYFGVRTGIPQEGIRDLESIVKQEPILSLTVPINEVKQSLRSIKDDKTGTSRVIFQVSKGNIVVGQKMSVFVMPVEFKNINGREIQNITLDFKLFNKLLQTVDAGIESNIKVYNRFITMTTSEKSLLIIGRS